LRISNPYELIDVAKEKGGCITSEAQATETEGNSMIPACDTCHSVAADKTHVQLQPLDVTILAEGDDDDDEIEKDDDCEDGDVVVKPKTRKKILRGGMSAVSPVLKP
jgi:uncharacterized membrane protein YkoI